MEYFSSCMLENVEGYWEMDWEERMRLAAILDEAHRKTWEHFGNRKDIFRGILFCRHYFWPKKQEILKTEYNIEWREPNGFGREVNNLDEVLPETLEQFRDIKYKVEHQAREAILGKDVSYQLGACHFIWIRMKHIFLEEYGIEWLSPRDLHPGVLFD